MRDFWLSVEGEMGKPHRVIILLPEVFSLFGRASGSNITLLQIY
jgi:hypothetical protein